jgi:hypothetical protein
MAPPRYPFHTSNGALAMTEVTGKLIVACPVTEVIAPSSVTIYPVTVHLKEEAHSWQSSRPK